MFTDPYNPYGANTNPREVAPTLHQLYQGESKKLVFVMPEDYEHYDSSNLRFVIVDDRFKREILFEAATAHYEEKETPEEQIKVQVTVPASVTATFRRGSFLYSFEWKSILGDERKVIEEGNLLVEYQAGAPNPDVPYKLPQQEESQNDG